MLIRTFANVDRHLCFCFIYIVFEQEKGKREQGKKKKKKERVKQGDVSQRGQTKSTRFGTRIIT